MIESQRKTQLQWSAKSGQGEHTLAWTMLISGPSARMKMRSVAAALSQVMQLLLNSAFAVFGPAWVCRQPGVVSPQNDAHHCCEGGLLMALAEVSMPSRDTNAGDHGQSCAGGLLMASVVGLMQ